MTLEDIKKRLLCNPNIKMFVSPLQILESMQGKDGKNIVRIARNIRVERRPEILPIGENKSTIENIPKTNSQYPYRERSRRIAQKRRKLALLKHKLADTTKT